MLDTVLKNHARTVVDGEGRQVVVKATCAEVNGLIGSHVDSVLVPDGNGGQKTTRVVVSCADADVELNRLRTAEFDLTNRVGQLEGEVQALTSDRDNCHRLMAGAIQVIFGMGPALQGLLSDDLGAPELTSDRSAVKLESAPYTVVIDVFGERIIVRPAPGSDVPEKSFPVRDGRLGEDNRTLLLGHVTRIKAVAAGQDDPVREPIALVQTGQTPA
jgi:hypothetical protein